MAIKIESSLPQSIEVLKLAPIWSGNSDLDRILSKKDHYLSKLLNRYVHPYFLGGILRYVEKGENLVLRQ